MKRLNVEELIDTNAAALEKGISQQALTKAIKEGRLKATLFAGRWLIRRADLLSSRL